MTRWQEKAEALSAAWRRRYGTTLTPDSVALALAPAQLETQCGDAWPGERNWGACTLRALNDDERAVLDAAGIKPTVGPGHAARAREAMAALAAAGFTPPSGLIGKSGIEASSSTIHCDSRTVRDAAGKPKLKPYFVWFANFESHTKGAEYYLHLLGAGARRAIEINAGPHAVALAMYDKGYFWGFKPHEKYIGADGLEHDGNAENVAAYAKKVAQWYTAIRASLTAGEPTLRRGDKGEAVRTLQRAIGVTADGAFGPRTEAALRAYQSLEQIVADGVCGPRTWAAIRGEA